MKAIALASFFLFGLNSYAVIESVYTSVLEKDCITIESSEMNEGNGIDYYTGECQGLGDYQVSISGGDIRYPLYLKYQNISIRTPIISTAHIVGSDSIEWMIERTLNADGIEQVQYRGLIYRMLFQNYNQDTDELYDDEMLISVKLDGPNSCVVGFVSKHRDMNEYARGLISQEAPCFEGY